MAKKVFITGISGFLGSSIAESFIEAGYQVIGLVRPTSDLHRCEEFKDKIHWIGNLDADWKEQITSLSPEIFIHSAWEGVSAADRDNWTCQLNNIQMTLAILELAKAAGAEKFIGLGSQAEYGLFDGIISEDAPLNPESAYGLSKSLVSQTIKSFCNSNQISWCWLRLFSLFGEKEGLNWFIPTVINNMVSNKPMEMTLGLQQYGYMYVKDMAKIIVRIAETSIKSDVYNLSSSKAFQLREVVSKLTEIIKPSDFSINYGAIPYRKNQPMLILGDTTRLKGQLGELQESDFDQNLQSVVEYIREKLISYDGK